MIKKQFGGHKYGMTITGDKAVQMRMSEYSKIAPKRFEEELTTLMDEVVAEAKEIVPYKTGKLQKSGRVVTGKSKSGRIKIFGGFGRGKSASYARMQHENMAFNHADGKQPKYLEMPFRKKITEFMAKPFINLLRKR